MVKNKDGKCPNHTWDPPIEITPIYGRTFGKKGPNGECEIVYSDVEAPEKYSWQKHEATGSFSTLTADKQEKQNNTELNIGNQSSYVADGISSHCDGHRDTNSMSTERRNCMGDIGESGKKNMVVFTEGKVESINEGSVKIVSAASGSWSGVGTFGNQVNEHSGDLFESIEGDSVLAVSGNRMLMIEKGDHAVHVQQGNHDTHVAEKGRLYFGNDLLIESATKITLKVGSSTIVITPSNIEVIANGKSGRIDLN